MSAADAATVRTTRRLSSKSRGGRLTRNAVLERDRRLLDNATELFLERGFDATSIDAVADAARVSKPTVYAQYGDKRGLFKAVLKREIDRWLAPLAMAVEIQLGTGSKSSPGRQLFELGKQMIAFSTRPHAGATGRILASQATNFPELAELAHREGWLRAVANLARLFERFNDEGLMKVDPAVVAEVYLNVVIGRTSRLSMYGQPIDLEQEEKRLRSSLKWLLSGLLPR
jgi:TetR/AcrR family transcriptional regulator, mexJK operon transcriptional repressor